MTVLGTSYRLGSTSYVWSGDLVPNVRNLGPLVDDVELVLFDTDRDSNLPSPADVHNLKQLATAHNLTFTVHLPMDLSPTEPLSWEKAQKVIACTRDLEPWAYVAHLDGRAVEGEPGEATLRRWQDDACRVLDKIEPLVGGQDRLCIENLENYAPESFLPLLERMPVSLCIDVGHLWLIGRDPAPFLQDHLARTRVVHIHGVTERDHQSLARHGLEPVTAVMDQLSRSAYSGVLTMEVFGREDFDSSRALIVEIVNGRTSS